MITKMPVFRPLTHGTRLWVPSVQAYEFARPRPSVVTLGGIDVDNSTGVSAAERHR